MKPSPSNKLSCKPIDFSQQEQVAFKFMYLGKNYNGVVIQSTTTNTVEDKIFNAFKKCCLIPPNLTNEEIISKQNFSLCGRTDKGVNSTGNIFSLLVRSNKKYNYTKMLNNLLPDDIQILGHRIVDDSFDARFSCLYREYKYFFIKKNMNISLMQKACDLLEGTHNFRRFCKLDKSDENYQTKNYERRIYEIRIEKVKNSGLIFPYAFKENSNTNKFDYFEAYMCVIKGSAFLYHQVRCIMGILFLIGNGSEEVEIIEQMLDMSKEYEYKYGIADDLNLVLTDCVFEFVNFEEEEETRNELYYKMERIHMNSMIENVVNNYLMNVILNFPPSERMDELLIDIDKKRRVHKYTKMLNHKTNRKKNK